MSRQERFIYTAKVNGHGPCGRGSLAMTSHSDVGFGAAAVRGRSRTVDVVASCSLDVPRRAVDHLAAGQTDKSVTSCLTSCLTDGHPGCAPILESAYLQVCETSTQP